MYLDYSVPGRYLDYSIAAKIMIGLVLSTVYGQRERPQQHGQDHVAPVPFILCLYMHI